MADPANVIAIDDIRSTAKAPVRTVVATRASIEEAINKPHRLDNDVEDVASLALDDSDGHEDLARITQVNEDAPIVKLANLLIRQAIQDRASDIHVEPTEREVRVRYRIDGVLHEVMRSPKRVQNGLISRLKIMADLNIAERRIPQDGRVSAVIAGRQVDLRVAALPTVCGELNDPAKNIITVEDPVEYRLNGIKQVQVNVKAGMTFAAALRSILRSDPDIVLVGEVRDRKTATIAMEAALTGHLVLSTLHTNDSASNPTRLIEMASSRTSCRARSTAWSPSASSAACASGARSRTGPPQRR